MSTTDEELAEQIAYVVHDMRAVDKHPGDDNHPFNIARAVLPIIEGAVRAGKAEALREVAPHLNDSGDEAFVMDAADLIEKETPDEQ